MNDGTAAGLIASGFWYFVGVSIGVLLLITALTMASYLCARSHLPVPLPLQTMNAPGPGIDEATILSYPKLLFCEARRRCSDQSLSANCCSICLSDYTDNDVVRVLPDCRHLFHLHCVDPWLRMHPTCPNCRTSPLSKPLAPVLVPSTALTPS